jgi:hypothetical protein
MTKKKSRKNVRVERDKTKHHKSFSKNDKKENGANNDKRDKEPHKVCPRNHGHFLRLDDQIFVSSVHRSRSQKLTDFECRRPPLGNFLKGRKINFKGAGEPSKKPDVKNRVNLIQLKYSKEDIDIDCYFMKQLYINCSLKKLHFSRDKSNNSDLKNRVNLIQRKC